MQTDVNVNKRQKGGLGGCGTVAGGGMARPPLYFRYLYNIHHLFIISSQSV